MLRKCLMVVVAIAGLGLAACGSGPIEPMPGDDGMGMLITKAAADSLGR